MSLVNLEALGALPDVVEDLQRRVAELEGRLTVAERKPVTVAAAAAALGVSTKTIRRRIAAGEIQHARTGSRVVVYLPPADSAPEAEARRARLENARAGTPPRLIG